MLKLVMVQATNPLHPSEEESEDPTASFAASLTAQELEELKGMVNSEYVYSRLVESIAPTVSFFVRSLVLVSTAQAHLRYTATKSLKRVSFCNSWEASIKRRKKGLISGAISIFASSATPE